MTAPVPVYISYLTVDAEDMVFRPDIYGRDRMRVAGRDGDQTASR